MTAPATPSGTMARAAYRPEQAMDSWQKVLTFLHKNLGSVATSVAAE